MRCPDTQKLLALCFLVFFILLLYFNQTENESIRFPCRDLANVLGFPKDKVLVWAEKFVTKIEGDEACSIKELSERVAIPGGDVQSPSFLRFTSPPNSNYYLIHDKNQNRALHKKYFHEIQRIIVPSNFTLFYELWKRSTFVSCLNLKMERNETKRHNWLDSFALQRMEQLLFHFVDHQMFLILAEGTLLGWYRECNIIPHTSDCDFAYRSEEYKQEPFDAIVQNQTEFRALYRYGTRGVDLEWTFFPSKTANFPHIDLFEVKYRPSTKTSYYTAFRHHTRIEFSYPIIYDPWCAGDLKGFLFWVPCSVDTILAATYGKYKEEIVSSKFVYDRDSKNFKRVHTYTSEEWSSTYFKHYRE